MNGYWITGLVAIVIGTAAGAGGAHYYYGGRLAESATALANEKLAHTADLKAVSDKAAGDAFAALAAQRSTQEKLAASDAAHTQEMDNAKAAIDKLRSNDAVRLRIAVARASRPAGVSGMPQAASTGGVDDGTVDLAPSARAAYFDLRQSLADDTAKISALQDYARVCHGDQ